MASELSSFFSKHLSLNSKTHEEQLLSALLFSENVNIHLGDRRLNNVAALTYNTHQCDLIFQLLEKSLIPENNPWQTLYKAILVLHTILLYGSEYAVDKAINICDLVNKLQTYNSALIHRSIFSFGGGGGTDYGHPVRQASAALHKILLSDDEIRNARSLAHADTDSLVPLGDFPVENLAPPPPKLNFGQAVETSVGAGYDLSAVPGMYDGRPERYFDSENDIRRAHVGGDHQITREAMNPNSLLDLAFDNPTSSSSTSLPPVEYLPALEEQERLRRLLAEQQEQLDRLRALTQQQQLQQQQQQQQFNQMPQSYNLGTVSPNPVFGAYPTPPLGQMPVMGYPNPQDHLAPPYMPPQVMYPGQVPYPTAPSQGHYPPVNMNYGMNTATGGPQHPSGFSPSPSYPPPTHQQQFY